MAAARAVSSELVGREPELAAVSAFLDRDDGSRALVLSGEPGIGKTAVWEAAVDAARQRGFRVLAARASDAEARMSFAVLVDLLEGVDLEGLGALPPPQLQALRVALLRVEPQGAPSAAHAIGLGLLGTLRAVAADERLVIAIDDSQWIDGASAAALVFAGRRLGHEPVVFMTTRRLGMNVELDRAFDRAGVQAVDVGPLSLGAIRRLLSVRLDLSVPRPVLRRIADTTLGNPLFALEIGRRLTEVGLPHFDQELPVPDAVEDLIGTRFERLSPPQQRLLLAVALSGDLTLGQTKAFADASSIDDAAHAGLLVIDGDRVRAAHPLMAAAAVAQSKPGERRELHRRLAELAPTDEVRARHLALMTDRPDAQLATTIAAAARAASARGAWQGAAVLGEHALRLTPADAPERAKRAFDVAITFAAAGESERLEELVTAELASLPPGPERARMLLLTPAVVADNDEILAHFEQALHESRTDPTLQAAVLGNLSFNATAIRVERIREAEMRAEEALPPSRADPEIERSVLYALAYARALRGREVDDICERYAAISEATGYILASPERIAGVRLAWRGEVDHAREHLRGLLALADERGDVQGYATVRTHVCELELRAGEWQRAAALLEEWAEPTERDSMGWPAFEHCQALLAVGRGLVPEAEQWSAKQLAAARTHGVPFHELEARRIRGLAALLAHDPARALDDLRAVWERTQHEGVEEPGAFPVAPDLVEALVELGDLDQARRVTDSLYEVSKRQGHPWGAATAKRCDGLVRLAAGFDDEGVRRLEEAAERYDRLGLRFDAARTLLLLGRAQRRHRKWGAARGALERAEAAFGALASPGWLDETRSERERVGARRPQPSGELTPTERRITELAAEGLANKEIAQALFITVKTVEKHLSHAYAKLGVRSRAQLGRRLSDRV